ncbi:MAG: AmmeMemoRadiSam system protein B [Deltaproteobacteria bacterium]|nr:AmmeMemoRadiSam system protein B [Deltaproteobacteria bacterium]
MRNPAVAGAFYPGGEQELIDVVDGYLARAETTPSKACAVVSPHAGYVYSGGVAGEVFGQVEVPGSVVVLGPKHRYAGERAAVSHGSGWRFPFGEVPIDGELAGAIVDETFAVFDNLAHRDEHSLEVQVPFIWRRNPQVRITAVALGMHRLDELEEFGKGLARAVEKTGDPVLLVASTDMSHQVPEDEAGRLDDMAIQRILAMDPSGLYDTVMTHKISMCGVIPTTAVLHAALALGSTEARLVRYANSGEVSGDRRHVVGYAGLIVS